MEQVLVFETNGPVREFLDVVRATPGLSWLAEEELTDLDPDADFYVVGKETHKKISARVYVVLTNQKALEQLLALWAAWKKNKRGIPALKSWRQIFSCLRDARRWGVKDRLKETGILARWKESIDFGSFWSPVEIVLWFNDDGNARTAAEDRIRSLVAMAGGTILQKSVVEEIAYHALLAHLPADYVARILKNPDVELVAAQEVRFFRPTPQMNFPTATSDSSKTHPGFAAPANLRPPVVALLDGLPIENHVCLQGRLRVDDPDGLALDCPVAQRRHGTAMASLILHGDLSNAGAPSGRELYVRPILRLMEHSDRETVPENQLWVDLVHRAVRRIVEGDGHEPAAAPSVRIVNFALGDSDQPFANSLSPIARLLDWLSWKYRLLFVVSAGNHTSPLTVSIPPGGNAIDESAVIQALYDDHRHRRLLAPAEALNVLTVGASHEDNAGAWISPSSHQQTLVATDGLPSPFSALGRGYRRAVKPDVLAPGGRAVFNRQPGAQGVSATFEPAVGPTLPGQRVAAPGRLAGELNCAEFTTGTSNAAALTTRLAASVVDIVEELQRSNEGTVFSRLPSSLVAKALVVHSASWNGGAFEALAAALKTKENAPSFRDLASAFLGYGQIDTNRAIACTEQRATFLSGGFIQPEQQWIHSLPVPACLHAQNCWRKLTITLAWFTPIAPRSQKYRGVSVAFIPPSQSDLLHVSRSEVHGNAVSRGTVQHEVLKGYASAMDIADDAKLEIPVNCFADAAMANALPGSGVPYALAVSLEVAPKMGLPIYEEVRARIQPRVVVGAQG